MKLHKPSLLRRGKRTEDRTRNTDAVVTETAPPQAQAAQIQEKKPIPYVSYFHFVECTECKYVHPLTEENIYQEMIKQPDTPQGVGMKCPRCGSDTWTITAAGTP